MEPQVTYRRHLHQIPETAMKEVETGAYIYSHMQTLNCACARTAENGVLAFFDNGASETIAFRADIDALSISEQTGLPFAAKNGCMHACGHDGHAAMLMAFADYLSAHYKEYQKNLLLIFQPAEESIGGARIVCEEGVLERYKVSRIFAFHIWPGVEKGALAVKGGPTMARTSEVYVRIKGKSAHCAYPEKGVNALVAGCQFVSRLERYKAEELPKDERYLLHSGVFSSGDARNIISQHTNIQMSVRAFNDALFDRMQKDIRAIAKEIDQEYKTETEVETTSGYFVVVNDLSLAEEAQKVFQSAGMKTAEQPQNMGGEDFSYYLKQVPGIMIYLGAGDVPALHNDHFDFDESILADGVKGYIALCDAFAKA